MSAHMLLWDGKYAFQTISFQHMLQNLQAGGTAKYPAVTHPQIYHSDGDVDFHELVCHRTDKILIMMMSLSRAYAFLHMYLHEVSR